MKFIFDLDNKDLLPRTLEIAKAVEDFSKKFGLKDLRTPPEEGESAGDAARRNLKALMKVVCVDHPEEAGAISDMFWVLENKDEKAPNAIVTANTVINRKEAIDFFTLSLILGQIGTNS